MTDAREQMREWIAQLNVAIAMPSASATNCLLFVP